MIRGNRVVLRALEESDLGNLQAWINDPEMSRLVVGWSFPVSMVEQQEWFQATLNDSRNHRWIIENGQRQAIGLAGLWNIHWQSRSAEAALKLSADARGQGLGTDALLALMAYAFFEVGLNRLSSTILSYNKASHAVFVEHAGWTVEGRLRQAAYRGGSFHDLLQIGVLREDFLEHPKLADYAPGPSQDRADASGEESR